MFPPFGTIKMSGTKYGPIYFVFLIISHSSLDFGVTIKALPPVQQNLLRTHWGPITSVEKRSFQPSPYLLIIVACHDGSHSLTILVQICSWICSESSSITTSCIKGYLSKTTSPRKTLRHEQLAPLYTNHYPAHFPMKIFWKSPSSLCSQKNRQYAIWMNASIFRFFQYLNPF